MVWSKNKNKKIIFLLLIIFFVLLIFFLFIDKPQKNIYLRIADQIISVSVADDSKSRQKGLVGVEQLSENQGMIFLFDQKNIQTFWMKDMSIPIDIVWLDDYKVVGFQKNALPEKTPPYTYYYSPLPVKTVLELPAGWLDRHGVEIGDVVEY